MSYYENKKVLITGASSGIGVAFARQLAEHGAEIIITARRKEQLDELAGELQKNFGTRVLVIPCDLSDPDAPERLCRRLDDEGVTVDILINNAGFGYNGLFADGDLSNYEQMIQVNISATVGLTRLLLPGMLKRKSGGVLNVASVAGFAPVPWFAVYSATKQFVINFSWSLWWELRGTGVHCSVLCPGPVDTGFLETAQINRKKTVFRGLQSPDVVAVKGLKGLSGNKVMQMSRPLLRLLYLFSRWLPVKAGMITGALAMKKQR